MNRRQRVVRVVAHIVIGVCLLAVPALAQDCPDLVRHWPAGPFAEVAVSSDYAYVASEFGLLIVDVSIPSAPQVVSEIGLPGGIRGIDVSGDYAYVTCDDYDTVSDARLRVIDISVPSAPIQAGFVDVPDGVHGVAVSGGYAFVAWGEVNIGGLRVIDVRTPSAPVEVGSVETADTAYGVKVSGGHAFVANDEAGLVVIDISDPAAPFEVGSAGTTRNAFDVAVSEWGAYAYVTGVSGGGLSVVDVATPSAPVEVGYIATGGLFFTRVAALAGFAYVAGYGGLHVIDVSSPAQLIEVGSLASECLGIAVSSGYAFISRDTQALESTSEGLWVVDLQVPSAPAKVGSVFTLDIAENVAVSERYAYVSWHYEADAYYLRVFDVISPATPVELGFLNLWPASVTDLAVSSGFLYVAGNNGLGIIDVSDPTAPVEVGSWNPQYHEPEAVAVSGAYAYLADSWWTGSEYQWGLRVIDVRTPSDPVEVGLVDMPVRASDVTVSGDYAYVTCDDDSSSSDATLRVIDISVPPAPSEVGVVNLQGAADDVTVCEDYAYVLGGHRLSVIDVSTPSSPVEVGSTLTIDPGIEMAVSNGLAYIGFITGSPSYSGGLRVIDVRNPWAPVELGFFETSHPVWDVAVTGGYVFVAARIGGVYVFNECTGGLAPDGRECFLPAAAVAAGAEGAFFSTDVEINNTGTDEAQVSFQWLPRGEDNSEPIESEPVGLAAGQSLLYENVLTEVFGLEPDSLGALKMVASTESVIGMSRTYNSLGGKAAGTFGQGLPAVRATEMIMGAEPQRILFLSEDDDSRANIGCVNGTGDPLTINIGIFDDEGSLLETTTLDLGPWSNDQINRVFEDYAPVNGYVDVWGDSEDALFTCYGSMLDNLTSDPTTILPQVPSSDTIFIPAAALGAGLEGAFFTTDVDLNNVGSDDITYEFLWLPRGADNSEPTRSDTFSLTAGSGVRYANVLGEVFGLEPDQVGALEIEASGIDLLAMSRTYNTPSGDAAGTFGQGLSSVPADRMIPTGVTKRIIFLSERDDFRANLGCVNGAGAEIVVAIDLYDSDGAMLETRYMVLPPYSNWQFNEIFQDYAPVNGYVEVRTNTPDAAFTCYGSVLDNLTSDPTTVLPQ